MFNGEGSYVHCSGATYNGMWINGRPEGMSLSLELYEEEFTFKSLFTFT